MDLTKAAAFLADRYGAEATGAAELGGGDWSRAFSFRLGDRDLVIRFGRHVEDFLRDRKAAAFSGPDLPVPPVLEIGEAAGMYYAVSERRFGRFLEELDGPRWRAAMPALLRSLDAMRELVAPGHGVDWGGGETESPMGWRDWLLSSIEDRQGGRVSGWRETVRQLPEIDDVFVKGERALHSLLPSCPELRHVIHRDLLNRNVLVSEDGSRVTAVFDWGCSLAGDFLYEVAWLTFWSPWYPPLEAVGVRGLFLEHYRSVGLEVPDFEPRLACYEVQIGLEHIGYSAFTGREGDLRDVALRTREATQYASRW
jgi:hygromycin-B 4-O-kinase